MLLSGGELVLADTQPSFAIRTYYPGRGLDLTALFASYGEIYRKQLWVYVVVRKRSLATARLPLKVYERDNDNDRLEARDNPYAVLLRQPNPKHDPFFFWQWTSATYDIYGEAIWAKVRGRDGKPAELWPIHPSNVATKLDAETGDLLYLYLGGAASTMPQLVIPSRDIVHFKTYNPDSTIRGLAPLEPLRQSLVNEDAARRAAASFWAKGARPGTYLSHPAKLSPGALNRLKASWDESQAGVDNFGSTAVLEEGMTPHTISLSAEEAQYIQSRMLNREEVCGAYDTPPPVVHILEHATYSNITEQMRSMYRDTMAPHLGGLESTLDQQLRPDFASGDSLYAEFLMDEVLRGDYETRMEANQKAINSGQMTPNEARRRENQPAMPGGDRLYMNSTNIPIDEVSSRTSPNPPAEDIPGEPPAQPEKQPVGGVAKVPPVPAGKGLSARQLRTVIGRLSRPSTLAEVDTKALTAGLNGEGPLIERLLDLAIANGDSVAQFKDRLRAVTEE